MNGMLAPLLASMAWLPMTPADSPTYPFTPASDDFRPDALLDLRYLNEKVAGESGFIKVDSRGNFLLGNGKPVRFWAVNTGIQREKPFNPRPLGRQTDADLARGAKFLAKRGVNMTRLHAHIDPEPTAPLNSVRQSEVDWIWRHVAAMKKEGIYSTISPYWAVPAKIGDGWGVPGGSKNPSALGLLFFDETLQRGYKSWLRELFAKPNPYTGIPLAKDPSVAIIQIQNEDSLLFWTVNNIQGEQRANLERKFGAWLKRKYPEMRDFPASWNGNRTEKDAPAEGRYELLNIWELTQDGDGGRGSRRADQLEFLTRTMYEFNANIAQFLRTELGCQQIVNAGNWRTADTARLQDAERWSYSANEVDAVNRYFGGIHKGVHEGWAIQNGDKFTQKSVVEDPAAFPLNLRQTRNRPMMITESSWVFPNGRGPEGPFVVSAYQSLTGVDAFFWFASEDDEWTQPQSANGYNPSQKKWFYGSPDVLGNFPAAALIYRTSKLEQAPVAELEWRPLSDLWQRKLPRLPEEAGFDPNRDTGSQAARTTGGALDPLAFFVGPVQVQFGADLGLRPTRTEEPPRDALLGPTPPTESFIDRAKGIVRSRTGQLDLRYRQRLITMNAPGAVGVSGFLAANSPITIGRLKLTTKNDFGAVSVVAMDDQPLGTSKKILVQYGTEAWPTDWAVKATTIPLEGNQVERGLEVVNYGKAPWQVFRPVGEVTLTGVRVTKATVLDANGNARGTVPVRRSGNNVTFAFPSDALYVILQ